MTTAAVSSARLQRILRRAGRAGRVPRPSRPCAARVVCVRARCAASSSEGGSSPGAAVGDLVKLNYSVFTVDGEEVERVEELSFEVGAPLENPLFKSFDAALRGKVAGETVALEATGAEWDRKLVFKVPSEHPEITRLNGRYKNQGGLKKGGIFELANGAMALVMDMDDKEVTFDCNNMLAGQTLRFELEVLDVLSGAAAEAIGIDAEG